jgi:hypothetical protein
MAYRNSQALSVQWNPQKRRPPDRPPTTPVLRVAVQGSEIVVSASGNDYVVRYHKPANSSQLLARSFPRKEDRRGSMTLADFLTAARKLANDKARELGWSA